MILNRLQLAPVLVGVALILVGCGGGPEIKGKATLDDKPLAHARVRFEPLGRNTALGGATAVCDDQGNFNIARQAGGRTLEPGKFGVTVSRKTDAQGNVPKPEDYGQLEAAGTLQESVPARYTSAKSDGTYELMVEIKESDVPPIDLKLSSK
jgi:hypothetical protein